jgi:hypothetical protein
MTTIGFNIYMIAFGAVCVACGLLIVFNARVISTWQARLFDLADKDMRGHALYLRIVGAIATVLGLYVLYWSVSSNLGR